MAPHEQPPGSTGNEQRFFSHAFSPRAREVLAHTDLIFASLLEETARAHFAHPRAVGGAEAHTALQAPLEEARKKLSGALRALREKKSAAAFGVLLDDLRTLHALFRAEAEENAALPPEEESAAASPPRAPQEPHKVIPLPAPHAADAERAAARAHTAQRAHMQERERRREIAAFFQALTGALLEEFASNEQGEGGGHTP